MLACPRGTTIIAASSGPTAYPACPPIWNMPWAKPCWPAAAWRAIRVASGWNTAEPSPIRAAETSTIG